MMISKEILVKNNMTYADLAHELGICEMAVRNKVAGRSPLTKLEREKIEQLFHINVTTNNNKLNDELEINTNTNANANAKDIPNNIADQEAISSCTILRSNR